MPLLALATTNVDIIFEKRAAMGDFFSIWVCNPRKRVSLP